MVLLQRLYNVLFCFVFYHEIFHVDQPHRQKQRKNINKPSGKCSWRQMSTAETTPCHWRHFLFLQPLYLFFLDRKLFQELLGSFSTSQEMVITGLWYKWDHGGCSSHEFHEDED